MGAVGLADCIRMALAMAARAGVMAPILVGSGVGFLGFALTMGFTGVLTAGFAAAFGAGLAAGLGVVLTRVGFLVGGTGSHSW